MQPVLKNWLLVSNEGKGKTLIEYCPWTCTADKLAVDDKDFRELRAAYIPETVLAYISCLHFAGTSLSRDNLLECMELAAVIAEKGSDVAQEFLRCNRMKELVEAFASCSKALAIWTSDKKAPHKESKKIREMGWYVSFLLTALNETDASNHISLGLESCGQSSHKSSCRGEFRDTRPTCETRVTPPRGRDEWRPWRYS